MSRLKDLIDIALWLIKKFRKPIYVYIVVSKNSMTLKNLETYKSVTEHNRLQFSSSRLLIADPLMAEKIAIDLLNQIFTSLQLKTRALNIICHPLDNELSDLSPAEKMIFNDFACQIGGSKIRLINNDNELTLKELKIQNYFE